MSELSPETKKLLARGSEGEAFPRKRRTAIKRAVLAKAAGLGVASTSATAVALSIKAKVIIGLAVVAVAAGGGSVGIAAYKAHEAARAATTPRSARVAPSLEGPIATAYEEHALPAATIAAPESAAPTSSASPLPFRDGSHHLPRAAESIPPHAPLPGPLEARSEPSSLAAEAALLRDAHQALAAGDAARCLALLDEHAARFPHSFLEPERSAERVFALCVRGAEDEAHIAAAKFLRAYPVGPLSERVRTSCGGSGL